MADEHDHFGPECPQCRALADQANILGGFAESMQQMIDNGTFERLGREMAMRREQAIMEAVFRKKL